jgi:hypothetical protein
MHVFPPAVSATHDRYEWLFRQRADHPDHPMILAGPSKTPPPIEEMRLPRGGYRLRDGAAIDPAPFETLRSAVTAVNGSAGEEDLQKLGLDLFTAWIDGSVGAAKHRDAFLERLYRRHRQTGHSLAEQVTTADEMLRYREFLADAAREIAQEAFRAARAANPERYDAQARAARKDRSTRRRPAIASPASSRRSTWRAARTTGCSPAPIATRSRRCSPRSRRRGRTSRWAASTCGPCRTSAERTSRRCSASSSGTARRPGSWSTATTRTRTDWCSSSR